jgi:serine/threonine protein phosphatase 1
MNTYVMSDIHGCYDEMNSMFETINFTENDQLIIAGDYIDRGKQSYEMLCWMENVPDNVLLIKGNHDVEFAYSIELMNMVVKSNHINIAFNDLKATKLIYELTQQLISDNNNGMLFDYYGTLRNLINEHNVTLEKLNEWKIIIDDMPNLFKIKVNGKKYIIVHAGYIEEKDLGKTNHSSLEDFYLYARDEAYTDGGAIASTIISGHTPTLSRSNISYNNGLVYKKVDDNKQCIFYNIDCGCAYKETQSNAHLACIRLNDEELFYI